MEPVEILPALDYYREQILQIQEFIVEEKLDPRVFRDDDIELIILRILIGHDNDIEGTWKAFKRMYDWRLENKSWLVRDYEIESPPYNDIVIKAYPKVYFHKHTVNGMPVLYNFAGRINAQLLADSLAMEDFKVNAFWTIVQHLRYLNKLSRETGILMQLFVLFDCAGISISTVTQLIPYLTLETTNSEVGGSEIMYRTVVLNAPSFFGWIYQLISAFGNERTLKKVKVIGSDYAVLTELIPKENLPIMYNGANTEMGNTAISAFMLRLKSWCKSMK